MRLGIGSYTYGWAVGTAHARPAHALSAVDLIDRAVELRVGLVQLCDNLPPSTFHSGSVKAIGEKARRAGVRIQVGTCGTAQDHLRRFVDIARQLGSNMLRVVIDQPGDHPGASEVVDRLGAIAGDLEAAGVTLAVENHDRFPAATLLEVVRALETPKIGICLDTVNSFGALEGPRVVVDTLGPHVVNLHLKDFVVARLPHLQGFLIEGKPVGGGMLDVPWLLGRLREFGRDPDAIIEHWVSPEPEPSATLNKEAAWAALSVNAARQWIND